MAHITKRNCGVFLFVGSLICFGDIAGQRSPSQRSEETRSVKAQPTQTAPQRQNDQLRDQLAQLQMQLKDLQTAIDDLRSEQQRIGAIATEAHDLVLDSRVVQTQGREDLNSLVRTVGRNEKQVDKLGQQVSSMMLDLQRVKTKVGLY